MNLGPYTQPFGSVVNILVFSLDLEIVPTEYSSSSKA